MSQLKLINPIILIGSFLFTLTGNIAFARISNKGAQISKSFTLNHRYGEVRVEIHGFEKDRDFIAKTEKIIKRDVPKLFSYFKYIPQSTMYYEVESDIHVANGMAMPVPHNKVVLYNFPPGSDGQLLASDDWIRTLIVHETVHIIHMDYTTGWVQGVRNVFGSIAKIFTTTPRWFTEGIAVWAETVFTKGGRNRYIMNDLALAKYMSTQNACSDISCISEVSTYPYMGMAYLMGGKFMAHIEKNKKGAIACIVRENSNNLSGLLDNAFIDCTGKGIVTHYNQFLARYKRGLKDRARTFGFTPLAKASNKIEFVGKGNVSLDQGQQLIDGKVIFGSYYDRAEYMNALDIKTGALKSFQLENKLDFVPSPTDYSREHSRYPIGVYEYQGISDRERRWFMLDGKSLESISEIEEDSPSQYLFQLNKKDYISLRFERDRWWVYDNNGPIYNLEKFRSLSRPFVTTVRGKDYLIYQTIFKNKFALQALDLKTKSRKNLFSSKTEFNLAGHYKGYIFINRPFIDEDKMVVISLEGNSFVSEIEKVHQIGRVIFDKENTVFLHQHDPSFLYNFKGNGESFIAFIRARSSHYGAPKFMVVDKKEEELKRKSGYQGSPLLRNFVPGYWLLTGVFSGEMKKTSISTMVTDPLQNHILEAELLYYGKENSFGANLIYDYQFVKKHYLGGQFWQHYGYSEYRDKAYREDEYELHLRSDWEWGRNLLPTILSIREERDANVLRDKIEVTRTASLDFGWSVLPKYFDDTLNLMSLNVRGEKTNGTDLGYYSLLSNFSSRLYFHPRFEVVVEGLWGRNYKNELTDGVIELDRNLGPIQGGDIFGNNINYANLKLDLTGHVIYKGWGNKPIFLKEIHYIGGIERAEADFIFSKGKLLRDQELYNGYYGMRADMRIFYMIDVQMQATYSHILNNGERKFLVDIAGLW
ncbi:MAG: hypothetical protein KAG61_03480 [Bacteriovoracaceae bacterium]|nr:hypothetical protein [Bacteriovoracaceae bacterium]